MKTITSCILLLLAIFNSNTIVYSQQNYKVEYLRDYAPKFLEELKKNPFYNLIKNNKYYFLLSTSPQHSYFICNEKKTLASNPNMVSFLPEELFYVYKNFEQDKILMLDGSEMSRPLVYDKLPKFNWKIEQESKIIAGLACQKATTEYNNDTITAWFTKSIPLKSGLMLYGGLPGLILQVENSDDIFTAQVIEKQEKPENFVPPNIARKPDNAISIEAYNNREYNKL